MATPLFGSCDVMTVQGIKNLKLAAKNLDGSPIDYPIDFVLVNGEESTIRVLDDPENQLMLVDESQIVQYVEPYVLNSSFEEVQVVDRRGNYYQTTITIEFPKLELLTNVQIKDFLIDNDGLYSVANATAFLTDNNDVDWVIGYDLPLVVDAFEQTTGGGDNRYSMTLIGRSYNRARRLQYVKRLEPEDFILINPSDFLLINSSGDQLYI